MKQKTEEATEASHHCETSPFRRLLEHPYIFDVSMFHQLVPFVSFWMGIPPHPHTEDSDSQTPRTPGCTVGFHRSTGDRHIRGPCGRGVRRGFNATPKRRGIRGGFAGERSWSLQQRIGPGRFMPLGSFLDDGHWHGLFGSDRPFWVKRFERNPVLLLCMPFFWP